MKRDKKVIGVIFSRSKFEGVVVEGQDGDYVDEYGERYNESVLFVSIDELKKAKDSVNACRFLFNAGADSPNAPLV